MIHLQARTEPGRDFFEQIGGGMTRSQAELLAYVRRESGANLSYGKVIFAPFVQDMNDVLLEIRQRLLSHDEHPGVRHMSGETAFHCYVYGAIIGSAGKNVNS